MQSECMPWRTLARVQLSPSSRLIMTPWPMVPTRIDPLLVMVDLLGYVFLRARSRSLALWILPWPLPARCSRAIIVEGDCAVSEGHAKAARLLRRDRSGASIRPVGGRSDEPAANASSRRSRYQRAAA